VLSFRVIFLVNGNLKKKKFILNFENEIFGDQVLQNDIDLLNPPAELEKRKHKLKRLVQSPNSFFMVLIALFVVL
jgi:hypothetical protein